MRRLLFALLLLVSAAPLFAGDTDGDPGYIPSYSELVREGYGPHYSTRVDYYSPVFLRSAPKPTQAYYMKGCTIYYGYTTVPITRREEDTTYAFGHPLSYFQQMMPTSAAQTNLNHYAQQVPTYNYEIGSYVALTPTERPAPVTTVQRVTSPPRRVVLTTAPAPAFRNAQLPPAGGTLPPIAEKPGP